MPLSIIVAKRMFLLRIKLSSTIFYSLFADKSRETGVGLIENFNCPSLVIAVKWAGENLFEVKR